MEMKRDGKRANWKEIKFKADIFVNIENGENS